MKLKLQLRYSLIIFLLVISVVFILSVVLLLQFRTSMHSLTRTSSMVMADDLFEQLKKRGESLVILLAENLKNPVYNYDMETIYELLKAARRQKDITYTYVYDCTGRIIHDGTKTIDLYNKLLDDDLSKAAIESPELLVQITDNEVHVSEPLVIYDEQIGGVRVGFSLEGINNDIMQMKSQLLELTAMGIQNNLYAIILVTAGLSFLSILLAILVARNLARPINLLSSMTRVVSRGDYGFDISIQRSDEIGDLAESFKKMSLDLKETTVSKDLFINIIMHMADTLIVLTTEAGIQIVNRAACDLLGYSEKELMGRHIDLVLSRPELILDEDQGIITGVEVTYRSKDGTEIPMLFSASPLTGPNGMRQGTICVAGSILERKQVEEALKESQAKFYTAFRSNPGAISINRLKDGRYVEINQGFTNMYGYERNEALRSTALELKIFGDRPQQAARRLETLMEHGAVRDFEFTFRRKNGESGTGLNFAEIIELGGQPHILSISIDITDRKHAEEARKKSEEHYLAVLEASTDPIVVYDLKGRCLYINPAFSRVFGWTLKEVIGKKIDYVPPENMDQTQERIGEILKGKGFYGFETKRYTKSGEVVDISMSAAILRDGEGNPEGSVINLQDITERKRAEKDRENLQAQLRQSQKMEAIGTLASGVAHEFNNILQTISGYMQLISTRPGARNQVLEYASEIDLATRRATDLVQRLLTFSRRVEPELQPVNLNRVVLQAVKILERTIPRMIDIETRLADDIMSVNADENQLNQVLMNLCANARDAMPYGGRITIVVENKTLDSTSSRGYIGLVPGRYVLLKVSDTGQGLDGETRKHIFEPFYTTKEIGEGTGLGLSIVYGIVKGHGGYIDCHSEIGQGATFMIYFPAALRQTAALTLAGAQFEPEIRGGEETVLVVDDEKAILDVAREILDQHGYTVLTASSGEEALSIYRERQERIDLVILDLGMPGMGGRRCLEALLDFDPGGKVIIASGYGAWKQAREVLESGARSFISKPYRLADMLNKIREVLDE